MFKPNFNIILHQPDKTKPVGYLLLMSKGRKNRKRISTGIRIDPDKFIRYWNEEKQQFKSGLENYKAINEKIEKVINDNTKDDGKELAPPVKVNNQSFLKYWQSEIDLIPKIGSKVKHSTVKKKLEKYLGTIKMNDITFSDLTPQFVNNLHYYFQKAPELTTSSVNSYMKLINNIVRRKTKDDPYTFAVNPFASIRYDKKQTSKRKVLTAAEINSLLTTRIEDAELDFVRDMYTFQIFSSGMRVSDLCLLRWSAIKTTYVPDTLLEGSWFDVATGDKAKITTVYLFDDEKTNADIKLDYVMYKTREPVKTPFTYFVCKAILKAIGEADFFNSFLQSDFRCLYDGRQRKLWELVIELDEIENEAEKKELKSFIANCEHKKISALLYLTAHKVSTYLMKGNKNNFVFPILKSADFENINDNDLMFKDVISKTEDLHHKLLYGEKIYRRQLDEVGKLCNVKDIMPHAARHTFTQLMINAGAPTHKIMSELGHTTLAVTDSYTRHKEFSDRFGEDFLSKVGNKVEFLDRE